jgi:uncharacterized membrane protein YgcG
MTARSSKHTRPAAAALVLAALAGGCCSGPFCGGGFFSGGLFSGGCIATNERNMIPNNFPLGSVVRSHFHAEQTNAEATNFIFNLVDFVGETPHLTPDGKDHLMEVAARMRSAPFPVIIERTPNNANPQLDAERRAVVSRYLADLGNPDADQRTVVSTAYSRGYLSTEGASDYYTNFNFRSNYGNNGFGGGGGGFGGGGGGGGVGGGGGGGGGGFF